MRIGILSDTHGYLDPNLPPLFQGVSVIFHAGDVGGQPVLDQLRGLAPVEAVTGNIDPCDLGLPSTLTRQVDGVGIYMLHQLPYAPSDLREWATLESLGKKPAWQCRRFLESLPEGCRVIIFGHSHEPCGLVLGSKLFCNPGSAGKKRFSLPRCCGVLEISSGTVQATFLSLESYNQTVPEAVRLPLGGTKPCGKS
jgi:hypothetical protein